MFNGKQKAANFLDGIKTYKIRKKNKKFVKYITIFVVLFMALTGLITTLAYPKAKKAYNEAIAAKNKLFEAEEYIKLQDYSEAQKLIQESHNSFNNSSQSLNKISYLQVIPFVSKQYKAINVILETGAELTDTIDGLVGLAVEVMAPFKEESELSFASISSAQKREILAKIDSSDQLLKESQESINNSAENIKDLPKTGLIGPIKEVVDLLKDYLPKAREGISQITVLARVLPHIAGYPESSKYFFLLQNNSEMRPTGGFIGTYGIINVKDAEIINFKTDNVYNLDEQADYLNITPPAPLAKYNKVEKWFLRDSNWSPDFPVSAEKALWFYEQEGGRERNFDGVIAITPTLIESLIGLTGSIKVYGIEFTSDNFVDTLQYQVEKGFYQAGLEESERKEIIGDLSKILMDKIFSLPQEKWDDFFKILSEDLKEKHILIYLKDQVSENLIKENNWGGHIHQNAGDYFTLIDANLASLKTDPGVKRTLSYSIKKENNKYIANLEVIYNNEGTFTWKTTRYRTYFRLYVPQGSKLIDIIGTNEEKVSVNELGKTYFGSFVSIEPQEHKTIIFKYELPESIYKMINEKNYQLVIQKQAGTAPYQTNINLDFHKKIKDFTPIDKLIKESDNNITLNTKLSEDLIIDINFK